MIPSQDVVGRVGTLYANRLHRFSCVCQVLQNRFGQWFRESVVNLDGPDLAEVVLIVFPLVSSESAVSLLLRLESAAGVGEGNGDCKGKRNR